MGVHKFKEGDYKSNEEMFLLSDDEIISGDTITAEMQSLPDKCCRLAFIQTKFKICEIYRVHGEAIYYFDNTHPGDTEQQLPRESDHGWELDKPEEGFPCNCLDSTGCMFIQEDKPWRCKMFPTGENELYLIETCSYYYEDGELKGSCDGCKAGIAALE